MQLAFCSNAFKAGYSLQQGPSVTMQQLKSVHNMCSGACSEGPKSSGGLCAADGPREATAQSAACGKEGFADCGSHHNAVFSWTTIASSCCWIMVVMHRLLCTVA